MASAYDPKAVMQTVKAGAFTETFHTDTYAYITPSPTDHTGKSVLVTGASRGVGAATAVAYALAGSRQICIAARSDLETTRSAILSAVQQAQLPCPQILTVKLDVAEESSVSNAVHQVKQAFGKLDILINNAGYLESTKLIHDGDPHEWWTSVNVNLYGTYLVTRAFLPILLQQDEAQIINISSIGANMILPGMSAYNIAKLAVLRFTEYLNVEYAGRGLLSYSVHPGGVATELSHRLTEDKYAMLTDTPELPAHTIVWLTKQKRIWLAGRLVSTQWDMSELLNRKVEILEKDLLKITMTV